jgi:hypothetical protein
MHTCVRGNPSTSSQGPRMTCRRVVPKRVQRGAICPSTNQLRPSRSFCANNNRLVIICDFERVCHDHEFVDRISPKVFGNQAQ